LRRDISNFAFQKEIFEYNQSKNGAYMKKLLFLIILLISVMPVFAQDIERKMPTVDHMMLSKELANDKSIQPITCGLLTDADVRNKPNPETWLKAQKENSRVKLLFQASKTKNQTVKAKYACESGGGAAGVNYLTVENGNARFIEDLTRDASGGFRVNQMTCKNLNIGYLEKNKNEASYKFKPFKDENYGDKIIVLQCKTADRTFLF
jgi:hypothetical protein